MKLWFSFCLATVLQILLSLSFGQVELFSGGWWLRLILTIFVLLTALAWIDIRERDQE